MAKCYSHQKKISSSPLPVPGLAPYHLDGFHPIRFLGPQPVSHPRFGDDVADSDRIDLQFVPQVAESYPQKMHCVLILSGAPELVDQLIVGSYPVGMMNQYLQQVILGSGELDPRIDG